MASGGSPATTTSSTTPWSGVQPYLSGSLAEAGKLYESGSGYYPTSTVVPLSGTSQQAIDLATQRGLNGSPLQTAAQGNATSTLNGEYLNGNPNLQGAIDAATQGLVRQYTNATMPGLDAAFSKSGRFGSNQQASAVSDAQTNLASQVGNIATNMAYSNYNDERGRQVQTSALAPQLAAMDFTNLQALTGAGAALDTQSQAQLNDLVARYNYQNGGALDDYIARINGTGANNYKTSTETASKGSSPLAGALGGALSGGSTGAKIGSAVPGLGTSWGALLGAGAGGLAGLF